MTGRAADSREFKSVTASPAPSPPIVCDLQWRSFIGPKSKSGDLLRGFALGLVLLLIAGAAAAADQPLYAPPAAWVKPLEIPKDQAPDTTTPTRTVVMDLQTRLAPEAQEFYSERAIKIQTPQGLSAVGNFALSWRPDIDTLIVHKARILRGDQTIDLLAGGHGFTVLRRENNLEMAMLDGALTAAMQPEGLEVGDVLDLALTIRRSDPVLQERVETMAGPLLSAPADYLRVREIWPKSTPMRWRQTDDLPAATTMSTADGEERLTEMTGVKAVKGPKGAPPRYFELGEIEGTEFRSWAEVSALMAPLFEKASTLGAESPLKAEAAKIKAASDDPKIRAMAALRLVEDQIRYLFLGMNNGGYVPADADQTWSRRFGDCKGKTAILIALLRELGIEAEPALASFGHGDGLDARLPILEFFDHVLVRATIAGKVYWLDGTRTGDRDLDDLPIPALHWVLPVQESGATLVRLTVPAPDKPLFEADINLDASAGLDAPAPAHATTIFRGDAAIILKQQMASVSPADLENYLRAYWKQQYDWIEVGTVNSLYDAATGEARLSMDGSAKMEWKQYAERPERQYQADSGALGWKADFDRDPGPNDTAPFAVSYPFFAKYSETIRLPGHGVGFTTAGEDVDKIVAAREFKRVTKIEDGVFRMEASTRSLAPEFPFAEAPSAKKDLRALWDVTVDVVAPRSYVPTDQDMRERLAQTPTTADDFINRGYELQQHGDHDKAIVDFDRALKEKPDSSLALADRGISYYWKGAYDKARSDLDNAAQIDPDSPSAIHGHALLDFHDGEYKKAIEGLSSAIARDPQDGFAFEMRGISYHAIGDDDKALSDFAKALILNPSRSDNYARRAEIFLKRNDGKQVLAEAEKLIAAAPDGESGYLLRATALNLLNRKAEAEAELDHLIAVKPTARVYLARARLRDESAIDQKLTDIDAALALEPSSIEALESAADLYLAKHDYENAIKALNERARLHPDDLDILRRRARAFASNRQYDLAIQDATQLLAAGHDKFGDLQDRCRYKAALGADFDDALADCAAALKLDPASDEAIETRAFAYQRFGRLDQAMADYDAVLSRRPNSAIAHFGRGVTELRLGRIDQGKADLVAARKVNANIDAELEDDLRAPDPYRATEPEMKLLLSAAPPVVDNAARRSGDARESSVNSAAPQSQATAKVSPHPISRVAPLYPARAEDNQIEGYVDFDFTVEPDGSVGHPIVVMEVPEAYGFADAALKVFPKWAFAAATVNGVAVATPASFRISFKLGK
jgi:TonB family protein